MQQKQKIHKFDACKHFSNKHGYNFGFVRSKDEELYINNEEYVSDMNDEKWKRLNIL